MKGNGPATRHAARDLGVLLRESAADPRLFENLLSAWIAQFENEADGPDTLTDAAGDALGFLAETGEGVAIGARITQQVNALRHCVIATCSSGRVTGLNTRALAQLDVAVGDPVDAIGYELDLAEPVSQAIRRLFDGTDEILLKRAYHSGTGRQATLAILMAQGDRREGRSSALVFVIDPEQHAEAEALIARAYGLTEAEAEVLSGFLRGETLAEIAAQRDRSLATVRTQFQSAMGKTGATSQADLMRTALAISEFVTGVSRLAEVAHHPHRRTAQVLRPGGRTVDVTLAGDMTGAPMIFLSTLTHHALPAEIEAKLQQAGLLAIHVWRPGFGATDPPATGESFGATLCGDIAAILSQLGCADCTLVGLNASTRDAIEVGVRIPDRISCIASIGPMAPHRFRRRRAVRTPWAEAIYRTPVANPVLLGAIVRVGLRSWKLLGTRRFASMQLRASTADLAALDMPGVVGEVERAVIESNAQGVDANMRELGRFLPDWSDLVRSCPVPVVLLHGTEDPCTHISVSHEFAAAYPDRVSVAEIDGAGFYALFSHPDKVIARLADLARR